MALYKYIDNLKHKKHNVIYFGEEDKKQLAELETSELSVKEEKKTISTKSEHKGESRWVKILVIIGVIVGIIAGVATILSLLKS